MKNLHLFQATQSKLYYTISMSGYNLKLSEIPKRLSSEVRPQHIYITNSEQIRLNDYITDGYSVWKWKDDSSLLGRKKVILTTDPTLIADNVQGIDDYFLEWFVKNPTCEEVKIVDDVECLPMPNIHINKHIYKIIIPKEEDKPKYTNQKLWEMAKVITEKQKAATEIDLNKVDWNIEEMWYDWLEEELNNRL